MAYRIDENTCISCGSCEGECPVQAIEQGDAAYEIDEDSCIDCGSCSAVCPVEAISPA